MQELRVVAPREDEPAVKPAVVNWFEKVPVCAVTTPRETDPLMVALPVTLSDPVVSELVAMLPETTADDTLSELPVRDPVRVVVPDTLRDDETVTGLDAVSGPLTTNDCPCNDTVPLDACMTSPLGLL